MLLVSSWGRERAGTLRNARERCSDDGAFAVFFEAAMGLFRWLAGSPRGNAREFR